MQCLDLCKRGKRDDLLQCFEFFETVFLLPHHHIRGVCCGNKPSRCPHGRPFESEAQKFFSCVRIHQLPELIVSGGSLFPCVVLLRLSRSLFSYSFKSQFSLSFLSPIH